MFFRKRSRPWPDATVALLGGDLRLPLLDGWTLRSDEGDSLALQTDVPGATVTVVAERHQNGSAIKAGNLARYISPKDGLLVPGMVWSPADDGPAYFTSDNHRGLGPHLIVVHALLDDPWIYRVECGLPLRSPPDGERAVKRLLKTEPVPSLMYGVLAQAYLDLPAADVPPPPRTGKESQTRARFFEFPLPESWICWEGPGDEGGREFLLQSTIEDHPSARISVDPSWIDLGFTDEDSSSLPEVAITLLAGMAKTGSEGRPDDTSAERRPCGGPTLCHWRDDEALVKRRQSKLVKQRGEDLRVFHEHSVRLRLHRSGCRLVHFHVTYPEDLRADREFQSAANRLWLCFLEGRFLDGD